MTAPRTAPDVRDERVTAWLMGLEGVLMAEGRPIPGADAFVRRLRESGTPFLLVTNGSTSTPRDVRARLRTAGIDVPEDVIFTSAVATAAFLHSQRPKGSAYAVGDVGLTNALHEVGYVLTDRDPDYVVLGGVRVLSFEAVTTAVRLVLAGARFVVTNPDPIGPTHHALRPATGSIAAMISRASGVVPYSVGKPNPLMMRAAMNRLGVHSRGTTMVGDRMDTDIKAGVEAGLRTVLVRTGIAGATAVERFAYQPTRVVSSVAELTAEL